jgi:hypothetical protein
MFQGEPELLMHQKAIEDEILLRTFAEVRGKHCLVCFRLWSGNHLMIAPSRRSPDACPGLIKHFEEKGFKRLCFRCWNYWQGSGRGVCLECTKIQRNKGKKKMVQCLGNPNLQLREDQESRTFRCYLCLVAGCKGKNNAERNSDEYPCTESLKVFLGWCLHSTEGKNWMMKLFGQELMSDMGGTLQQKYEWLGQEHRKVNHKTLSRFDFMVTKREEERRKVMRDGDDAAVVNMQRRQVGSLPASSRGFGGHNAAGQKQGGESKLNDQDLETLAIRAFEDGDHGRSAEPIDFNDDCIDQRNLELGFGSGEASSDTQEQVSGKMPGEALNSGGSVQTSETQRDDDNDDDDDDDDGSGLGLGSVQTSETQTVSQVNEEKSEANNNEGVWGLLNLAKQF